MASTYSTQSATKSSATPATIIAMASTYSPRATTPSPATPTIIITAMASTYTPQATTTQSPTTPTITIALASAYSPQATIQSPATPAFVAGFTTGLRILMHFLLQYDREHSNYNQFQIITVWAKLLQTRGALATVSMVTSMILEIVYRM